MLPLIQRIATGPKLSKDLSREQACLGLDRILSGRVHPVQAAIFFIALRMKRESDEENLGLQDAIFRHADRLIVDVPELVDVSDPYDGFSRLLPVTPFLPPVLAACGLPAVSHGAEGVGPKYGLTHAQVLRAAGVAVSHSPADAARRLADPALGWAYVDQSCYCPALYGLCELRRLMVKRTALSTLERIAGPLRARDRTHLLTGYVHSAYPPTYALLAKQAGFDSALIVNGPEGGVAPSLRRAAPSWGYIGAGELRPVQLEPVSIGFECESRGVPLPDALTVAPPGGALAPAAAACAMAALDGASGPAREVLVYTAAACLRHAGREPSLAAGAAHARSVIDSGAAKARLEAACRP